MSKQTRGLLAGIAVLTGLAASAPAHAAGWFQCGNLLQVGWSCQVTGYPNTQYEYGIAYNSSEPLPVNCTYWNYGMRIYNRDPYFVMSDNPASSMNWGGFAFYFGTLATDDDTCNNSWRHRYWFLHQNNAVYTGVGGNGCHGAEVPIFCRAR